MELLDESYRKRHIAQMLIETGGWLIGAPESMESRLVFFDSMLDKRQVEAMRTTYPVLF